MKYAKYESYVPSESVWLDQLPAHWEQLRVKHVIERMESGVSVNSDSSPAALEEVGILKTSCVYGDQFSPNENKRVLDDELGRVACHVKGNRLIISRMNTPELVGSCGYVERDYPNLFLPDRLWQTVFSKSRECLPRFAWYYLTSRPAKSAISSLAAGTSGSMQNIGQDAFVGIGFPLPSLDEQQTIVRFLDAKIGQIDALVAQKRQLIAKLKEKRSALISRTVTRGLPPEAAKAAGLYSNPEIKESEVDWLGQISSHWNVVRLRFLLSERLQYGANEAAELDDPELPRFVRITDVDDDGKLRPETFRSLPTDVAKPYLLKDGDVLFARSGATSGKTFLYKREWGVCAYAGYLIRARLDQKKMNPSFLRLFTASDNYWQWVSLTFIQATIQNISAEKYTDLWVPIPPIDEQAKIVDYLSKEISSLNGLVDKASLVIDRLTEYRQALITAAVTGKIDVRGVA